MSQHRVRSLETTRNALMQKASSQKSSYSNQKCQNFVLKNIYCFHKHGKLQTFDLWSFPSNLTEVTKREEAGAPAGGSAPAEVKERLLEMSPQHSGLIPALHPELQRDEPTQRGTKSKVRREFRLWEGSACPCLSLCPLPGRCDRSPDPHPRQAGTART